MASRNLALMYFKWSRKVKYKTKNWSATEISKSSSFSAGSSCITRCRKRWTYLVLSFENLKPLLSDHNCTLLGHVVDGARYFSYLYNKNKWQQAKMEDSVLWNPALIHWTKLFILILYNYGDWLHTSFRDTSLLVVIIRVTQLDILSSYKEIKVSKWPLK